MAIGTCALILLDGTGVSGTVVNLIVADAAVDRAPDFHAICVVPIVTETINYPVFDGQGDPVVDGQGNLVTRPEKVTWLQRVQAGWVWNGKVFSAPTKV